MRSRTLARSALVVTLALGLAGGVGSTAVGTDKPQLEKASAPIGAAAGAPSTSDTGRSAESVSPLSLGYPDAEWTTFRHLNLLRLDASVEPVIRHGGLDSVATNWLSTQTNTYEPQLDPNLEAKVPAGSAGGMQLIYWWENGTDVQRFLELVADELYYDGVDADVTDSGIAIGKSSYGLFAYYILLGYPHSTPNAGEMPLYRFYKPSAGTHFYSTSKAERNSVIGLADYRYEALVAYIMAPNATSTTTPLQDLNRFQLKSSGTHFYTSSPTEYAAVLTYPQYSLDGVAGRVFAQPASGLTAMHRFRRPASGTHFYTANTAEVETVKTIPGYVYEGVAFYLRVAN
ncbi:hypothetical protein [uncultured Cellulomonas sp.]|uniref:hypothetical protein n=1 Tax=uncultured Cellulomonas sp. TaxID=189682 RepID=UPI0028E18DEB|nr:hypothetical protein [uncultured Cellulomonas sp.]